MQSKKQCAEMVDNQNVMLRNFFMLEEFFASKQALTLREEQCRERKPAPQEYQNLATILL